MAGLARAKAVRPAYKPGSIKRPRETSAPDTTTKKPRTTHSTSHTHANTADAGTVHTDKEHPVREKKNAGLIQELTKQWEKLRNTNENAGPLRKQLAADTLAKVKGRVAELALNHKASRILQSCAKHGTAENRATMLEELLAQFLELTKSCYASFLLRKLVSTASKPQLQGILRILRGHIPELLRHPYAAAIVDDIYLCANGQQRNAMVAEFYAREYVLFEQAALPKSLAELLESVDASKKQQILRRMSMHMQPILEKALLDPLITQRLLAEYLLASPSSLVAEAVESLAGPGLLRIVHTRDGAQAGCAVMAYGSPKERKKALKAIKGHVWTMAQDRWASLVLITALQRVDDTSLLRSVIIAELLPHLEAMAEDKQARRILLHLLAPSSPCWLPPAMAALVRPPKRMAATTAAASAADEDADEPMDSRPAIPPEQAWGDAQAAQEMGVSKKEPLVRIQELLGQGTGSLAQGLTALASQKAPALLRHTAASDVAVEIARGGEHGFLGEAESAQVAAVHAAIVEAAAAPRSSPSTSEDSKQKGEQHILEDYYSSRALRQLLLSSQRPGPAASTACCFAASLWSGALRGKCKMWVGTHGEKVLAALLSCGQEETRKAVHIELSNCLDKSPGEWAKALVGSSEAS
ncbi:hypothetical protein WJX84_008225 [Apatococcus fuscideae]|uniref:PUM-HD domain-containing protein n=1 Tax=Apatococcus fuscideae TaxID=2026836 RepID=A0AAW1T6X8_9CHLO